jgi:hypothetical protein
VSLKEILNQASQFQANVGSTGLDLSAMPIKLQQTFTLPIADDFNDGVKDPGWLTSPIPPPPGPPHTFAYSGTNSITKTPIVEDSYRYAQSFLRSVPFKLTDCKWRVHQIEGFTPPGYVQSEVWGTIGPDGEPDENQVLAVSNPIQAFNLPVVSQADLENPPTYTLTTFTFPTPPTLNANTKYAIVIRHIGTAAQPTNSVVEVYRDQNAPAPANGGFSWLSFNGGATWSRGDQFAPQYSNFNYEVNGQEINTDPPSPNPFPVETGGFLQFDYPDGQHHDIETIYDSPRGSVELETRFIWNILDDSVQQFTPLEWGLHMLQGPIEAPPLSDENIASKRLWELYIRPSAISNNLSFIPIVVDESGNRLTQLPSAPSSWQGYSNQGGWFVLPINTAAGVPITVKVLRQPNGGVIFTVYKNDDPSQVVFQTTASPPLRTLPGDIHLGIGHSPEAPGSRFRFGYFKLSGDIFEPDSGEVILRRSYPVRTKVTGYRMDRILPAPGSRVNVRIRSADTLEALAAAAFSETILGVAVGDVETGQVDLPAALFFDVKLEFIKASPGPSLNSFDFTVAQEAVEEDQAIILSVDEAGPGLVSAISSEEGLGETANTRKLVDGDPDSQWVSLGASDGSPVTLQLTFLAPSGGNELRNVNCLILRNTNLKALRVHIGVTTLFDGEILEDDVLIPFPLFAMPLIQIEAKTTKTPNQNKRIGEVYAGQFLAALPNFDAYEPRRELLESGSLRTLGGKLVAFRGRDKYASRWTVRLVGQPSKDEVERIFRQNPLVTFWPEPKARPRHLFDVGWRIEALPFAYSDVFKDAGHTLDGEVAEI